MIFASASSVPKQKQKKSSSNLACSCKRNSSSNSPRLRPCSLTQGQKRRDFLTTKSTRSKKMPNEINDDIGGTTMERLDCAYQRTTSRRNVNATRNTGKRRYIEQSYSTIAI